jgi:hypothetical protein
MNGWGALPCTAVAPSLLTPPVRTTPPRLGTNPHNSEGQQLSPPSTSSTAACGRVRILTMPPGAALVAQYAMARNPTPLHVQSVRPSALPRSKRVPLHRRPVMDDRLEHRQASGHRPSPPTCALAAPNLRLRRGAAAQRGFSSLPGQTRRIHSSVGTRQSLRTLTFSALLPPAPHKPYSGTNLTPLHVAGGRSPARGGGDAAAATP